MNINLSNRKARTEKIFWLQSRGAIAPLAPPVDPPLTKAGLTLTNREPDHRQNLTGSWQSVTHAASLQKFH